MRCSQRDTLAEVLDGAGVREVDAAARILDPILSVVNGGEHVHGKFLKDYRAIEW